MRLFKHLRIKAMRKALDAAQEAHNAALARKDTRAQHQTLRRLRKARRALMREELK